jgi:hypothetical protein
MNNFEARLHLGRTVRELLLDMLDDGEMSDKDYLELENGATEMVDILFEDWGLEVISVEAPFATVRLRLNAEEGPEVSP